VATEPIAVHTPPVAVSLEHPAPVVSLESYKEAYKRKRLTNPTYHFVVDFAEVGG